MIIIKKIVLALCIWIGTVGGTGKVWAIEKETRNFHEFELWHKLLYYTLSSDGEWAMWRIQAAPETDTLFIRNLKSDKEYKYGEAATPDFSPDSHWVVFSEPGGKKQNSGVAYQVKLLNLGTGREKIFQGIESFQFTKDSKYLILKGEREPAGLELSLYHLEKKFVKTISSVQEYTTDPSGRFLAYVMKTAGGLENGLEIMDLEDFRIFFPEIDPVSCKKLKWDDKGLMFMALRQDSVQQQNVEIRVVRAIGKKQKSFCLSLAGKTDLSVRMKISEFYTPHWSLDGKILFFGISPEQEMKIGNEEEGDVDIWHWKDQEIQSRQENRYYADRSKTFLCAWWPDKNQWRQLTDSSLYDVAAISASGEYILAENEEIYRPHYREPHHDIYLIQTSTGKRIRLLENTILTARFSREGKYVFYFKDKSWWAYDILKEKYLNLTAGIGTELSDVYYDSPIDIPPPFGSAGWLRGDKAFWFYDEYDVWSVELTTLKLKRLTRGREQKITFRKFQKGPLELDKTLLFRVDGEDGNMGFYRYEAGSDPQKLIYGAFNLLRLDRSAANGSYLFALEENTKSPELYVCDRDFEDIRTLSHTNLSPEGLYFRKSELIRYKNSQGQELEGALYYPVNYKEGKRYPMIVHIYERLSRKLNSFTFPSSGDAYNTTNYVLQGYFVFQPDIVYRVNHPGESAVDCVTAGVREVLKREDIDSTRLGLIGHSWGAYQTTYIITRTPLFAAAVAGAPLTNMISMYNSIYWENGRSNQEMFETGQARFRLPWWQIPDDYFRNSPVFQARYVRTPLLISFGTEDQAVNWSQGLEMYITMRRLGKPCILLAYKDEGHMISQKKNERDQTRRVMEYFDYYLRQKSAAAWILNGRSYLQKRGDE